MRLPHRTKQHKCVLLQLVYARDSAEDKFLNVPPPRVSGSVACCVPNRSKVQFTLPLIRERSRSLGDHRPNCLFEVDSPPPLVLHDHSEDEEKGQMLRQICKLEAALRENAAALAAKSRSLRNERIRLRRLSMEAVKSEALLLAILPEKIVENLLAGRQPGVEVFHNVTVFFSDIISFSKLCKANEVCFH